MNTLRFDKAACERRLAGNWEADGEEAAVRQKTRGEFIPGYSVKNGKAVLFDSKDEPSVFEIIIDQLCALDGEELQRQINSMIWNLINVIGLLEQFEAMEIFAKAWILDTLDERVDINTTDPYNDRWFDHLLYPRLSKLAKQDSKAFREFQLAMARFVSLPDLSSQNPVVYRKRHS